MVRIGGKGMSYIVKNCPCVKRGTEDYYCGEMCGVGEFIKCKNITDCVIKQVIEKCKEHLGSLETYVDVRSYECTMLQDILDLFDIEEINK